MYKGEAKLQDGTLLEITGTIEQCSNWADNVIRVHGECTVTVRKEPECNSTDGQSGS